MFGPLRLTRHRDWSATTDTVTTRWTLHVLTHTWQWAHTRPERDTDRASLRSWGWD